jgi:hypothetical protein
MKNGRRDILKGLLGAGASLGLLESRAPSLQAASRPFSAPGDAGSTVRDKFWIWGHPAGSHNSYPGLPGASRMTPAEGAFYLGVPNVIMVSFPDNQNPSKMLPEVSSYDQYAISLCPLKRVVWSLVGAGGVVTQGGVDIIRNLARKFPNLVGVQMDDFFRDTLDGGRIGALTPNELAYLRNQMTVDGRRLDLWVTVYHHDLKHDLSEYLKEVDVVTYWTWKAEDLATLEDGFAQAEQATPNARHVLGCYMFDYGTEKLMPINLMEKQCTVGLDWLKKGRIAGMIFLASCICDLNLEAVEWTRNWIREVGDQTV